MKRTLIPAGIVLVLAFLAGTFWYLFLGGRSPRLIWSIPLAADGSSYGRVAARFLSERELVVVQNDVVTQYDFRSRKKLWSVDLRDLEKAPGMSPFLEERRARTASLNAQLTPLYAELQKKRAALDPKNATSVQAFNKEAAEYAALRQKAEAAIKEAQIYEALLRPAAPAATPGRRIRPAAADADEDDEESYSSPGFGSGWEIRVGARVLVLVGRGRAHVLGGFDGKPLTLPILLGPNATVQSDPAAALTTTARIPLSNGAGGALVTVIPPDGQNIRQTYTIETPPPAQAAGVVGRAAPAPGGSRNPDPVIREFRRSTLLDARGLLQVDVRLVERRVTERDAMRASAKVAKEPTSSGAAGALEILDTMANDAAIEASGGKIKEDESSYEVALQPLPVAPGAPPWIGKVTGPCAVFRLNSVEVLASSKELIVFDKAAKKLWEAKLTYPIASQYLRGAGASEGGYDYPSGGRRRSAQPCTESGDTLYFHDSGVLAAFDLKTGAVRWRYNSVGISRLLLDGEGGMYLTSTTATPDALRYSLESRAKKGDEEVLIKLDAVTGVERWRVPRWVNEPYLTQGELFGTQTVFNALAAMNSVFDSKAAAKTTNWNLYRLAPRSGKIIGQYYQNQVPQSVEVLGNKFALVFDREVQVVHYLALESLAELVK